MRLDHRPLLGQFDALFTQLQNDVGRLLQLKAILIGLQGLARQPSDQQRIRDLLATQTDLENRLPAIMNAATLIRQQGLTLTSALDIAPFVFQMETQIAGVTKLQQDLAAQGIIPGQGSGTGTGVLGQILATPNLLWWVVGGLLVLKLLR